MQRFIKMLRSLFTSSSRLYPYLPIAREVLSNKIKRMVGDHSYNHEFNQQSLNTKSTQKVFYPTYGKAKLCMNPCNSLLILWYGLVLANIIYWFVETTIMVIYGQQAWQSQLASIAMLAVDVIGIIVFILDSVLQFNVGYISRGAVIVDRVRVVERYLHYYFYVDIVIVAILFVTLVSQNYYLNYVKLIVIFKFLRMLEMDELVMRKLSMSTRLAARTIYIVGKQFLTIFVLSHTIGVIFYIIDFTLVNEPMCQENNSLCWLYSSTAYSPILQYDWEIQYFYSVYWGVNTIATISYGDIAAANPAEVIYSLFCMCFACIVYSYITNNVIKAIIFVTQLRDQYRATLIQFDSFIKHIGLTNKAQFDTIDFLKYRHWEEDSRDMNLQQLMTNKLPNELKQELIKNAYQNVCNGLQYFLGESKQIIFLLQNLKQKKYSNQDLILDQGAPLHFLHYLHKGKIKILCNYYKNEIYLSEINFPDEFIAAYQFFVRERSQSKVVSRGNSVFYLIPQDSFDTYSQKDSQLKESIHLLWYQLKIKQNLSKIFYKCIRCGKTHNWRKCNHWFPSFQLRLDQNKNIEQNSVRKKKNRHHVWRNIGKMKDSIQIEKRNKDKVLLRLQKRLKVMLKLVRQNIQMLQIDTVCNWSKYLTQENLQRLQIEWNSRTNVRKSSRMTK